MKKNKSTSPSTSSKTGSVLGKHPLAVAENSRDNNYETQQQRITGMNTYTGNLEIDYTIGMIKDTLKCGGFLQKVEEECDRYMTQI